MIFLDIETRSRLDVTKVGVHRMSMDPELRLLCLSYAIGEGAVATWHCAFSNGDPMAADPIPDDLAEALADPEMPILVWNEAFERVVLNALRRRYQLPHLPLERFICVMTLARAHNLPGGLDRCSHDWLPKADAKLDGSPTSWMWSTKNALLPKHVDAYRKGQVAYCERDVWSMRELYRLMLDPTPDMLEQYQAAAEINDRGCAMDMALIDAAITLAPEVDREIIEELNEITADAVKPRGPSLRAWLVRVLPPALEPVLYAQKKARKGFGWTTTTRPSTDRATRARLLEAMEDYERMSDVRRALDLYDEANRAAVTKYNAAKQRANEGVLQGQYLFNGASQTGRFSAVGMQVHNLIRMVPKEALAWRAAILTCSITVIRRVTGMSVNQALSRVIRTAFIAVKGRVLIWGDWKSIEARVLPWLSGDPDAEPVLAIFREDGDLYIVEARGIYGKQEIDKDERQAGKVAVLSLGYNGGVGAFQSMARNYGLTLPDEEATRIVKTWRRNNAWAPRFWRSLNIVAKRAIRYPNTVFEAGRLKFVYEPKLLRGSLLMFLPSGRPLIYPEASLETVEKFGAHVETVVFRHPVYGLSDTYGGKLAENATQAVAADLLRELLVKVRREAVLHTHDEVVLEVDEDDTHAGCQRLYDAMMTVPDWADGLPIGCEIEYGQMYKVGKEWTPSES